MSSFSHNKIRKSLANLPFSMYVFSLRVRFFFSVDVCFPFSTQTKFSCPFFSAHTRKIVSIFPFANEKWNIINFRLVVNCLFVYLTSTYIKQVIYSIQSVYYVQYFFFVFVFLSFSLFTKEIFEFFFKNLFKEKEQEIQLFTLFNL